MEYIQLNKESGSTTRINFNNGVPYISYRILDDIPWLKNAVSTRLGGVSKDYLASMNLGFNRGDLDENVIRNHEIFANAIGVNPKNIVTGNQTHTTNVKVVTKDDCGKGMVLLLMKKVLSLQLIMQIVCLFLLWILRIKPLGFLIPVGVELLERLEKLQ